MFVFVIIGPQGIIFILGKIISENWIFHIHTQKNGNVYEFKKFVSGEYFYIRTSEVIC